MNLNSTKKSLNNTNIFNSFFSGFSGGIMIKDQLYNLGFGISALGDAGYLYCITFSIK